MDYNVRKYSFISYKGGAGRTSALVNIAQALKIQGMNVLLIDLDFEASGIPIFSSLNKPDPLFQPDYMFRINGNKSLLEEKEISVGDSSSAAVDLSGFFTPLRKDIGKSNAKEISRSIWDTMPLYECRSPESEPLEGRMVILPIGGRYEFRDTGDYEHTNWTYFPLGNEMKEIFPILMADQLLNPKFLFFENLIKNAIEHCQANEIPLDYILIDERPGIVSRTLLSYKIADGIFLVGSATRANLAGLKELSQGLVNDMRISKEKKQKFPSILGMILSRPLVEISDGDLATSSVLSSLLINEKQIDWSKAITEWENESERTYFIPPNLNNYFSFLELQSENYMPLKSEDIEDLAKEDIAVWGQSKIQYGELKSFFNSFLPIYYDKEIYSNDIIIDLRNASRKYFIINEKNFQRSAQSIAILAGHLRRENPLDCSYKAWDLWYNERAWNRDGLKSESEAKIKYSLSEWANRTGCTKSDCSWRISWYYAQWLNYTYPDSEEYLNLAKQALLRTEANQNAECQTRHPEWLGDWRIYLLRARIERKLNENENADRDYAKSLICLQADIQEIKHKYRIITEIYSELAIHSWKSRDLEKAWDHFSNAIESYQKCEDMTSRCEGFISDMIDFYKDYSSSNTTRSRVMDDIYDNIVEFIDKLCDISIIRVNILLRLVDLRMYYYWTKLHLGSKHKHKEKIKFLEDTREILNRIESMPQTASYMTTNKIPGLYGLILLEIALLRDKDSMQYSYISDSLSRLIEAVNLEPDEIKNHILLTIVRCLDIEKSREKIYQMDLNNQSKDSSKALLAELMVRERDAFYSFEQAVALWLDNNHYFDPEPIDRLNEELSISTEVMVDMAIVDELKEPFLQLFALFAPKGNDNEIRSNVSTILEMLSSKFKQENVSRVD